VDHWGAVVTLTLLVIVGKFVAVSIGAFLTGNTTRSSVQAGMSLAQIGEFSFIIAAVGLAGGATRPFLYPVAVAVSAITTLTTPLLVRAAPRVAHYVDRRLPASLQTFSTLYASWFAGLRQTGGSPSAATSGIRRAVWLIVADSILLAGLIVAAAAEMGRLAVLIEDWLGWHAPAGRRTVIVLASLTALPFVAGLVRMTHSVAAALAQRALPGPARGLDRAAAPRGAFVATLQYAMLLAAAMPLVAVLLPLAPQLPVVGLVVVLAAAAALAVWRSAARLYGHARAGAEVIAMALTQHDRTRLSNAELEKTMDHVAAMLPGLGDPEPVRLSANDPGVSRTLRELDLRASTGATVMAIMRSEATGVTSVPVTAGVRLEAGDLLALAGTQEAIDAARALLVAPTETENQASFE
jgi:CPA2 family monovalent cation:H+ antiporter-2